MFTHPPSSLPFPYTTLFRSEILKLFRIQNAGPLILSEKDFMTLVEVGAESGSLDRDEKEMIRNVFLFFVTIQAATLRDRKSTRLNSSHTVISYAVFCLKKKK